MKKTRVFIRRDNIRDVFGHKCNELYGGRLWYGNNEPAKGVNVSVSYSRGYQDWKEKNTLTTATNSKGVFTFRTPGKWRLHNLVVSGDKLKDGSLYPYLYREYRLVDESISSVVEEDEEGNVKVISAGSIGNKHCGDIVIDTMLARGLTDSMQDGVSSQFDIPCYLDNLKVV